MSPPSGIRRISERDPPHLSELLKPYRQRSTNPTLSRKTQSRRIHTERANNSDRADRYTTTITPGGEEPREKENLTTTNGDDYNLQPQNQKTHKSHEKTLENDHEGSRMQGNIHHQRPNGRVQKTKKNPRGHSNIIKTQTKRTRH
ncbi:hypothetical protein BaRGS_00019288 [Batillaria attramentaria]|uniref:Uncharacterized protein n=1 Tax=Batillaria attramentaria TaxID=370345 RepID=A0ABD0KRB2_9CAEN